MSVQEKAQKLLPGLEFGVGEGLEEFGPHLEFSLHAARLSLARFVPQGLKANKRLVAASDDDLLTITSFFDETREVRLGVMDLDRGHVS